MKVTPDDPRLSAYLLGELTPEEADAIRRQAASDPALRLTLDELEKITGFLDEAFLAEGNGKLLPVQRDAILRASREGAGIERAAEVPMRRGRKSWIAGLAVAATIVMVASLADRLLPWRGRVGSGGVVDHEIALLPMPGPSAEPGTTHVGGSGDSGLRREEQIDVPSLDRWRRAGQHPADPSLPEVASLPATGTLVGFADGPETRLPVVIGRSSFSWVSRWIREKGELPPKNAVRVEELVNQSALNSPVDVDGIKLAIEAMECPWDSESVLVGVQVEAGGDEVRDLKLVFRSGAKRRVLGSFATRADGSLPVVLPADQRTLLLIELIATGSHLGGVEVHQGEKVGMHPVPSASRMPSDGLRHAALLAGFGLWLRNEGLGSGQLGGMLDEAADDADPVRADARRVIGEALKLAEARR